MHRRGTRGEPCDALKSQTKRSLHARVRQLLRRFSRTSLYYFREHPSTCAVFIACAITVAVLAVVTWRGLSGSARNRRNDNDGPTWLVGLAKIEITPTERVWLSGFASRNRTVDTITPLNPAIPLYARALSLRRLVAPDEEKTTHIPRLVIVSLDLIGIDRDFSEKVHAEVHRAYGLNSSELHLITSHTHSGPVVGRNLAPLVPEDQLEWAKIARYSEALVKLIVSLVGDAVNEGNLVACTLHFANGNANLAVNRRQVQEAEFDGSGRGDTDDTVPVMWFSDRAHRLLGGVYGYAAHATVLTDSYHYSGDYPGLTSANLEETFMGSTWLYLPGCGGDQNVYPRGTSALAMQHASTLSSVVSSLVSTAESGTTSINATHIKLLQRKVPLRYEKTISRKDLRQLERSARGYERRAAKIIHLNLQGDMRTKNVYDYPIAGAFLGELRMVFLGGEPTVGYCHSLRAEGADWVVGYTDDVMGYVATKKARQEGGREGSERAAIYYGLPAAWEVGIEETIVGAVRNMLHG